MPKEKKPEPPDPLTVRKALKSRGFVMHDQVQQCEACGEWAKEPWGLRNPQGLGGRDLEWCANCGASRSWTRGAAGGRREDAPFDVRAFLGLQG